MAKAKRPSDKTSSTASKLLRSKSSSPAVKKVAAFTLAADPKKGPNKPKKKR